MACLKPCVICSVKVCVGSPVCKPCRDIIVNNYLHNFEMEASEIKTKSLLIRQQLKVGI